MAEPVHVLKVPVTKEHMTWKINNIQSVFRIGFGGIFYNDESYWSATANKLKNHNQGTYKLVKSKNYNVSNGAYVMCWRHRWFCTLRYYAHNIHKVEHRRNGSFHRRCYIGWIPVTLSVCHTRKYAQHVSSALCNESLITVSGVSSATHTTQCVHIEILINHFWTFNPRRVTYVWRR